MLLVLVVVIVSSLIPAAMAARLASPSEDTNWKLPQPDADNRIRALLPFTVTEGSSPGVLAFLYDFFDAHSDGAMGSFSTDGVRYVDPLEGEHFGGVATTAWLAPYDLGVRQEVSVMVVSAGEDDICDLHLEIEQKAGQPRNGYRLSRVFVADLRNQLLGWRNLSTERVLAYIAQGEARADYTFSAGQFAQTKETTSDADA